MRISRHISITILSVLIASRSITIAVPDHVNYQGRLLNADGDPVLTNVQVSVTLWDAATDGTLIYTQHIGRVAVANGLFDFEWGDSTLLSALTNNTPWLELSVDGVPLAPRQEFRSVPYAIHAEYLGGKPAAYYATGMASAVESDPIWSVAASNYVEVTELATPGQSIVDWANVTNVPPDLADGDDIITESDPVWTVASSNYVTKAELQTSGQSSVTWSNLIDVPADIADGDDSGGGGSVYAVVDISGGGDFTDLNAAVSGLPSNTVIFIKNGTFTLTNNLTLTTGQRLLGESRSGVIIDGAQSFSINGTLESEVRRLTIRNGAVSLGAYGVLEDLNILLDTTTQDIRVGDYGMITECRIENAQIETDVYCGQYGKITHNKLVNVDIGLNDYAVFSYNEVSGMNDDMNASDATVSYNTFSTRVGVPYAVTAPYVCIGNEFSNCGIRMSGGSGDEHTWANNRILEPQEHGIFVERPLAGSTVLSITGNAIRDAEDSGIYLNRNNQAYSGSIAVTITGNSIHDCASYGIYNDAENAVIGMNSIQDCSTGIYNDGNTCVIVGNVTEDCSTGVNNQGSSCVVASNAQ